MSRQSKQKAMEAAETDFPRGGVKHEQRKRKLPEPVKDLFKTNDAESRKKSKADKNIKTPRLKHEKKKKKTTPTHPIPKESSDNAVKLKFKDVEKGMHVLGCVAKVDKYSLTLDLPGGLQGEVSITSISDMYTEQLKKLTSHHDDDDDDDDDDEEEDFSVSHLEDMFHPGMILPSKVMAIKIRSGSKKKIFLSINPKTINKDISPADLTEGLILSGNVTACEDHGYVIDIGVVGVTGFLTRKHAEKYTKLVNKDNSLQLGQVVRCCVVSVSNRVVKVGINPHQVEKGQLPQGEMLEKKAVVSGMKVCGLVKEVLKDGLMVEFAGQVGYVHRTHTTQYKHRKHFSKSEQVRCTVLYTLSDNRTIYLSLLPHLAGSTCSTLYKTCATLVDKTTPHDASVLDTLKKAVYLNMEDGSRALATLSNLSAVTNFKVPLHKTFRFGDRHRCTVFGFNLIENILLVHIQKKSEDVGPERASVASVETSPTGKRKATDISELKSTTYIEDEDLNAEPKSKKKKLETDKGLSKTGKKKKKNKNDSAEEKQSVDIKKKSKHVTDTELETNVNEMDTVNSTEKKKRKKKKIKDISVEGEKESCDDVESDTKQKDSVLELTGESKKKKLKKDKTGDIVMETEASVKKQKKLKERRDKVKSTEETDSGVEMNKISDSDDEDDMKVTPVGANPPRLSLSASFSWSEDFSTAPSTSHHDSSDDDADDVKPVKKTAQDRRNARIEEEKKIFAYERQQLEGDQIPVTSEDFDRLTLQSPDSSLVWTRYMALHLETVEIEKARAVAERALKTISFREEQEKLNIWVAYLNLENMYGGEEQLRVVFERAVQQNEPIKVYKQMVQIYVSSGKMEEAEKMYNTMCKKFSQDKSVWTGFGLFFFKNNRLEPARKLLQRCLKCLDKREHVEMISKFAQLEYKYGESQRGCTMFENILTNYPRRSDLWSVYLDMVIKTGNLDDARSLFERVIHMKMSSKKVQFFFKKYMEFEKHGDSKSVEKVKQKAVDYVESQGFSEVS